MTATILPRPFCGSRGRNLEVEMQCGVDIVHCLTCDALGPVQEWTHEGPVETYNKASAIRAWNRRTK